MSVEVGTDADISFYFDTLHLFSILKCENFSHQKYEKKTNLKKVNRLAHISLPVPPKVLGLYRIPCF